MSDLVRVREVAFLADRSLRITFSDGLVRELDFADTLTGVLATIDDDKAFAQVEVDQDAGTISWPGGIDFDPDVLHGDRPPATGTPPTVISEYSLQQTSR